MVSWRDSNSFQIGEDLNDDWEGLQTVAASKRPTA
jgi:hypothetical protein